MFSKVVENLDIVDKEYFGLRFVQDNSPTKVLMFLYIQFSVFLTYSITNKCVFNGCNSLCNNFMLKIIYIL